jgi:hypothetical protein
MTAPAGRPRRGSVGGVNPYRHLLDNPVHLEAEEHRQECRLGLGIPWGSEPPRARAGSTTSTARERLAWLAQDVTRLPPQGEPT